MLFMQYDAEYRACQHNSLAILKEFGFGKRLMESRIAFEVADCVERVRRTDGRSFDPDFVLMSSVVNVIFSILFGTRMDSDGEKMARMHAILHERVRRFCPELNAVPALRFVPYFRRRWQRACAIYAETCAFIHAEIADALGDKTRESFTRSYVAVEPNLTKVNVLLCDLITAGAETTATTLRWSLILLANHQDVQARLQKEIDGVVPRGERLPSLDDRPRLPYVESVIMEVMRFKTLLPLSVPRRTMCDTEVGGYKIRENTAVGISFKLFRLVLRIRAISEFADSECAPPERVIKWS